MGIYEHNVVSARVHAEGLRQGGRDIDQVPLGAEYALDEDSNLVHVVHHEYPSAG
jgi:hypothetical protein